MTTARIICGDAFAYVETHKPPFILTDVPHDLSERLSKLVERHRLAWVNASSPRWLVGNGTGEKIVSPYFELLRGFKMEDTVCDPFMGWGAVGMAALGTNKSFVGIDNKADRCAHAYDRLRESFPDLVIEREGF